MYNLKKKNKPGNPTKTQPYRYREEIGGQRWGAGGGGL